MNISASAWIECRTKTAQPWLYCNVAMSGSVVHQGRMGNDMVPSLGALKNQACFFQLPCVAVSPAGVPRCFWIRMPHQKLMVFLPPAIEA